MRAKDFLNKQSVNEGVDIGQEWMSDTELDQYVPRNLQQKWRELLGYDRYGRPSAMWVAHTDNYEPNSNNPQHRRAMVELANWWFYLKQIPNFEFFDVRDANDDELEWLVHIGPPGWLPPHKKNVNEFAEQPDSGPGSDDYETLLFHLAFNWWEDNEYSDSAERKLSLLGWKPDFGDDYTACVLWKIGGGDSRQYSIEDFEDYAGYNDQDELNEFAPGDGYSGDGGDKPVSWETAKSMFEQFAEDSNALGFEERDSGNTVSTTWGPEFGHPYDYFSLFISSYGDHAMQGMLLGILNNKVEEIKKFKLPMSTNGVDKAVRYYMALRS